MPQKFEERTGIFWEANGRYRFGLVTASHDDGSIEFVPVASADGVICYDDSHAKYADHRDNVRLKDCPPPFDWLCICGSSGGKCYAYANMEKAKTLSALELSALGVVTIDDGKQVSDRDFATVLDHPWPRQLELDRKPQKLSAMERLRMAQAIDPTENGKKTDFEFDL